MTPANRSMIPARRRLRPAVDGLEVRAMLNATALPPHARVPVHIETTVKSEKPVLANAHTSTTAHAASRPVAKATNRPTASIHDNLVYAAKPHTTAVVRGQVIFTPIAGAFSPSQIQSAYGVNLLGFANQGQGQTIGIVDEYNDPNIIADANTFSTQYGLPNFNAGGPTLTVLKDTTFGTVTNSPKGGNADTSGETALDVEWAHAMAPKANIILVEVPAVGSFSALLKGIGYAASQGASVVSLSYGGSEIANGLPALYSYTQAYLATGPATNVAVTVSTGDTSYPSFPASTPNVIGVGGSSLYLTASNAYSSETAWGGTGTNGAGGGGTTAFFRLPSFQSGAGITGYGTYRPLPDLALVADPYTGVSVYNSYDSPVNGGDPWNQIGGTSLASPLFAGMISIAQQERVAASKPILTSVQINTALYNAYTNPTLYASLFHDITKGSNSDPSAGYAGHPAGTGYDLATGLGSPIANKVVPYLVSL